MRKSSGETVKVVSGLRQSRARAPRNGEASAQELMERWKPGAVELKNEGVMGGLCDSRSMQPRLGMSKPLGARKQRLGGGFLPPSDDGSSDSNRETAGAKRSLNVDRGVPASAWHGA